MSSYVPESGAVSGSEKPRQEVIYEQDILKQKGLYPIVKRLMDIVLSAAGLVVLAVPMLVIWVMIKLESPGPGIFIHHRIGQNGKPLPLLKFRTMRSGAEGMIEDFTPEQKELWQENFKLDDDPRITRIGRFLRRTSLDELPQLVNILKGELSIVGPRPVIAEELERYGNNKDKFLSVPPGLTGYWQAYARSSCTYEERMKMELAYAEHANLLWDIRIIFATFGAVLSGRGAK